MQNTFLYNEETTNSLTFAIDAQTQMTLNLTQKSRLSNSQTLPCPQKTPKMVRNKGSTTDMTNWCALTCMQHPFHWMKWGEPNWKHAECSTPDKRLKFPCVFSFPLSLSARPGLGLQTQTGTPEELVNLDRPLAVRPEYWNVLDVGKETSHKKTITCLPHALAPMLQET